jgi:hypothetical protein
MQREFNPVDSSRSEDKPILREHARERVTQRVTRTDML